MPLMNSLAPYKASFLNFLQDNIQQKEPQNLYEPITYILSLGGKRLRPILTLMACELFFKPHQKALNAALAVELFHNFSLIHDDIMDQAPLRRGQETVHIKWDTNTGILSGDAMLILAYQLFENYDATTFRALAKLFSKTAIEVCEGQQYDVDFEKRDTVTIAEYLKMINFKTAVLVGAAMQMGAIIAGASKASQRAIYEFGRNLGIAFQIQDDYLDVFGDPKTFGKQLGGDIISNKKTYLYLTAKTNASPTEKKQLELLYSQQPKNTAQKIDQVKQLFVQTGTQEKTQLKLKKITENAINLLNDITLNEVVKQQLIEVAHQLIFRKV